MALIEDSLKGNVITAAAFGAAALVLPKLLPDLSPAMRSTLKTVVSLFMESESEAEGGIINRLAETALRDVLKELAGPGSAAERQASAASVIEAFRRTADDRAKRYGRDDGDHAARYERHIKALRHVMNREQLRQTGASAEALRDFSVMLAEMI